MNTNKPLCAETLKLDFEATIPLRQQVQKAIDAYLAHFEDHKTDALYDLVLKEVELGLLKSVMHYTKGNQSKAAKILGIARGTLLKLLKQHHFAE